MTARAFRSKHLPLIGALLVAAGSLTACGGGSSTSAGADVSAAAAGATTKAAGSTSVDVAANAASTKAGKPVTLTVSVNAAARAQLPAAVRKKGTLAVGLGILPSGFPPLAFVGDDKKTPTGAEPDLARLVAGVLGLKTEVTPATWDNMFVGIDSGKTDVGFSNITDTEKRKEKYDFASYRQDNLGFEVLASNTWEFKDDYRNLAGQTVAVGSGTNQEKILLEWQAKLKAAGKKLDVVYFPEANSTYLALDSGRISAYFAPNPSIAYHVSQDASGAHPTRNAGKFSGAGATLQGLIAATTKKDSGLAKPLASAINVLIENGDYAKWLAAWNLSNEAVPTSLVNPPGLPLTNS